MVGCLFAGLVIWGMTFDYLIWLLFTCVLVVLFLVFSCWTYCVNDCVLLLLASYCLIVLLMCLPGILDDLLRWF